MNDANDPRLIIERVMSTASSTADVPGSATAADGSTAAAASDPMKSRLLMSMLTTHPLPSSPPEAGTRRSPAAR